MLTPTNIERCSDIKFAGECLDGSLLRYQAQGVLRLRNLIR
jgi:hypothetical protein